MYRSVATTLNTGWPSNRATSIASAWKGSSGAPCTGRNTDIGLVRATTCPPTRMPSTPGSSAAAAMSIPSTFARGNGQRPTAMCRALNGCASSVKAPSPRSSRSSSVRGARALMPVAGAAVRSSVSDIALTAAAFEVAGDRGHDRLVPGAPTEHTRQLGPDLVGRQLLPAPLEPGRRHQKARRAEPALQRILVLERLLQVAQPLARRQRLDGRHLAAIGLDGEHQARLDRLAVDQHGAVAAHALLATDMGPRQPELVAQKVGQVQARLDQPLLAPAVHGHRHPAPLSHARRSRQPAAPAAREVRARPPDAAGTPPTPARPTADPLH